MADVSSKSNKRLLDPIERSSAVLFGLIMALLLLPIWGWSQTSSTTVTKPEPHSPFPGQAATGTEPWEYSLSVNGYLPENEDGYASPTFAADHKWLHLEARYNYENFRTGSLWMGYNFSWGKTWQVAVTPMIGGVFGRTNGIAPGCEASLAWKKLVFSLDNEYVFDTNSKSGNFYYAWPQVTYQPLAWLRVGAVAEHTKVFETKTDRQVGFLVGLNHKQYQFTIYALDPGGIDANVQFEVGVTF